MVIYIVFVKYIIGVQEIILCRERVVGYGFFNISSLCDWILFILFIFYLFIMSVCYYADLHDMGIRPFSCCSQQVQDQIQHSSIIIELICLCVCVC